MSLTLHGEGPLPAGQHGGCLHSGAAHPTAIACCSMRADLKVTGPFFFFYLNRYLWLKLLALFFVFFSELLASVQQLCSCQHFPHLVPAYLQRSAPPGPATASAPATADGKCKKCLFPYNWGCPWCWDSLPFPAHHQHGLWEGAAAQAPARHQLTCSAQRHFPPSAFTAQTHGHPTAGKAIVLLKPS